MAYRKQDINSIHQTQDRVADLGLMIAVACKHENACDDMMCKHLPMIFPPFLDVNHDNLLHPESKLDEVVPLEQSAHFPVRPVGPQLA